MKIKQFFLFGLLSGLLFPACAQQKTGSFTSLEGFPAVVTDPSQFNALTDFEKKVLLNKGTEYAFTGAFHDHKEPGTYLCKQCNLPLFRSSDKFNSGTGWPSYDDAIPGAVREILDADGYRKEIVCSNCGGHLGHVFYGEGFTSKDTRHCVNSASLNFVPVAFDAAQPVAPAEVQPLESYIKARGLEKYSQATFAGGCFWCTEASFEILLGVVDVVSGYSGGKEAYPSYEEVGGGSTGHAEAIAIFYDPQVIGYETLLEVFFTAHDPTQLNRQGPDVGPQYRSAIFYHDESQKVASEAAIARLNASGQYASPVVTQLAPYEQFWVAEDYHQDYYVNHPNNPYVRQVSKPKVEKVKKVFGKLLKEKE